MVTEGAAWYSLACKLHEGRDCGLAVPGSSALYRSTQNVSPCDVSFFFLFWSVRQLCTEEPNWLADVWCCPFCFCLNGVLPALVTEGTEGRGCWDVDPGLQGVVTDLAVSDAGEKVLLIVNQLVSNQHPLLCIYSSLSYQAVSGLKILFLNCFWFSIETF